MVVLQVGTTYFKLDNEEAFTAAQILGRGTQVNNSYDGTFTEATANMPVSLHFAPVVKEASDA